MVSCNSIRSYGVSLTSTNVGKHRLLLKYLHLVLGKRELEGKKPGFYRNSTLYSHSRRLRGVLPGSEAPQQELASRLLKIAFSSS
jgi:hypothetical protein